MSHAEGLTSRREHQNWLAFARSSEDACGLDNEVVRDARSTLTAAAELVGVAGAELTPGPGPAATVPDRSRQEHRGGLVLIAMPASADSAATG